MTDPPDLPDLPDIRYPGSEIDDLLTLVDRYQHRVTAVVSRFLDDPRDIEEAVQDTFVQAWRHRDRFRSEAAVFTWLYRIATNTALMRLRRRRLPTVSLDDPAASAVAANDPMADHAEQLTRIDSIRAALAALPDQQRLVVILRDVEGLSNPEVAQLLDLPVTTIKAQLHRARTTLRHRLHP